MALNKVDYIYRTTPVSSQNLNDIQDSILELETTARDVVFTTPSFSSLPQTFSDSQVTFQGSVTHMTTDLYVGAHDYLASNASAMTGNWTIDFSTEGCVTITGSISGTTTLTLYCRHM